jgi:hypothetical protein
MTKKDKQLRDKSGKFASSKPIALYDKNGNVAYFTKEELNGFKNPDCEPATKGFVKCLMRETRQHTHHGYWDGLFTSMSMIGGWFVSILLGASCFSINKTLQSLGTQYFVPVLLFSIAMTCMYCELMSLEYTGVEGTTPTELQKYTPPAREKKDECE